MRRTLILSTFLLGLASVQAGAQSGTPQLRGLWVDAFGPGIKTPEQVTQLVKDAQAMKVNVLFAQVGRRFDCYCNRSSMPRTDDPDVPAGFDPLDDLLTKAHAAGIQVSAWIITTSMWNSATPPKSPDHAFNKHGPSATGEGMWLTIKDNGKNKSGNDWVADAGNPAAAEYIKDMYLSVVKNYPVDGVQFDRVRYPDDNPVGQSTWGYNPTALARYRAETGATGMPASTDRAFSDWRRQQVTNLVRRTYLEVKKVRPEVWVNAATITYGQGPGNNYADYLKSRPYTEVMQDWAGWLRLGFLDISVMMNYKRDFVPDQATWFDQWNTFGIRARGLQHVVSGAAIYLNPQDNTVAQVNKVLAARLKDQALDGWAGYSYRTPDADVNTNKRTQAQVFPELTAKLAGPGGPFATPADWGRPNTRTLRAVQGRVTATQSPLGGRTVTLMVGGQAFARTTTDGNGYYGFGHTPLGAFEVRVDGAEPVTANPPYGQVTDLPPISLP